jgi:hypothetical protein
VPFCTVGAAGTAWLFLAASASEPRHLNDVVLGVDALRKRGTPDGDIHVFTEHPAATVHLGPFGITQVHPLSAFGATLRGLQPYESALVIVAGHGRTDGIGSRTTLLSPFELMRAVRDIPGLKCGGIVLGQCFAGIFNFPDATVAPELALIGATNLNESLSTSIELDQPILQLDGTPGLSGWLANIFLYYFFAWLTRPTDVDGDGALTLMDAYKFAGTQSNLTLTRLKGVFSIQAAEQLRDVQDMARLLPPTDPRRAAANERLQQTLLCLHLHQEPWLLNAKLVRDIEFDAAVVLPAPPP